MNHINRLYCAQSHFQERLGEIVDHPDFTDIKAYLEDAINEMNGQIDNTNDLYRCYNREYTFDSCSALLQSLEEDFRFVQENTTIASLRNINLLSYVQNIQNVITAAFQIIRLYKVQLDQQKIELIKRNYEDMKLGQPLKLLLLHDIEFA